jgi:hypothetical protein
VSGLLLLYEYSRTHNLDTIECPKTVLPLQSIRNANDILYLLPDFEFTLMTLARPAKFSNEMLVFYWLNPPSLALVYRTKAGMWTMRFSLLILCLPGRHFQYLPKRVNLLSTGGKHPSMVFRSSLELYHSRPNHKVVDSSEVYLPNSAKQIEST